MLGGEKHRAKGHRAIVADFDWSAARQPTRRWTPPKVFKLPAAPKNSDELNLSFYEGTQRRAAELEQALREENSVAALSTWHNMSEQWLQGQSGEAQAIGPKPRGELGRGNLPLLRWGTVAAPRGAIDLGEAKHGLVREDKALRRLYHIREVLKSQEGAPRGAEGAQFRKVWAKVVRACRQLYGAETRQKRDPDVDKILQPSGTRLPTGQEAKDLFQTMSKQHDMRVLATQRGRLNQWCQKMKESWLGG